MYLWMAHKRKVLGNFISPVTVAKELRLNLKWSVIDIQVVDRFLNSLLLVNDSCYGDNYLQRGHYPGVLVSLVSSSTEPKVASFWRAVHSCQVCMAAGFVSLSTWWSIMIRPKVEDTVFSGQMQVNKPGFYARKGPREPLVESVIMIVGIPQVRLK